MKKTPKNRKNYKLALHNTSVGWYGRQIGRPIGELIYNIGNLLGNKLFFPCLGNNYIIFDLNT